MISTMDLRVLWFVFLGVSVKSISLSFQLDFEEPVGSKGKSPWVTWNGEEIADSQIIIERLGRHYGKDFTSRLTAEQQAAARAISLMVTEHLCW